MYFTVSSRKGGEPEGELKLGRRGGGVDEIEEIGNQKAKFRAIAVCR